jgi:hypothetical protein
MRFMTLLLILLLPLLAFAKAKYSNEIVLQWKPLERAKAYELEVLTERGLVVVNETTNDVSYVVHLKAGAYAYKVRGVDYLNRKGHWSPIKNFVVQPGPPIPSGPVSSKLIGRAGITTKENLRWDESDEAQAYRLRVWKDDRLLIERDVAESSSEIEWPGPGEYRYRLAGIADGVVGEESEPTVFSVREKPPPAPVVLLSPQNGSQLESTNVNFQWQADAQAEKYKVSIYRADRTALVKEFWSESDQSSQDLAPGEYVVEVEGADRLGLGPKGQIHSFIVGDPSWRFQWRFGLDSRAGAVKTSTNSIFKDNSSSALFQHFWTDFTLWKGFGFGGDFVTAELPYSRLDDSSFRGRWTETTGYLQYRHQNLESRYKWYVNPFAGFYSQTFSVPEVPFSLIGHLAAGPMFGAEIGGHPRERWTASLRFQMASSLEVKEKPLTAGSEARARYASWDFSVGYRLIEKPLFVRGGYRLDQLTTQYGGMGTLGVAGVNSNQSGSSMYLGVSYDWK